ncbi:MAG: PilZ domain-containing protein [Terriglobales bacterium]
MPDRIDADDDRRRSPRFTCGGRAEINCLPSNGLIVPGTIRDLSLHGCWVETPLRIDCGALAEIVVRVNHASFRALGTVKAMRGPSGAGVEFVRMCSGGKDMLSALLTDLARMQALMKKLKSERRELDSELFRKELPNTKLQAEMLSERLAWLGSQWPAETLEEKPERREPEPATETGAAATQPTVLSVDLLI